MSTKSHLRLSALWSEALATGSLLLLVVAFITLGPVRQAPYGPYTTNGTTIIEGISYGGDAWQAGLRNGMPVAFVAGDEASGDWRTLDVKAGNDAGGLVSVPQLLSPPEVAFLLVALALFGLALLLRSMSRVPAWLALFGSVTVSASALVGRFAEPASLLCWLAPLAIAALALTETARSRWRPFIVASFAGSGLFFGGAALMAERPGGGAPSLLLGGPIALGLAACVLAGAICLRDALMRAQSRSAGSLRPALVFNELIPGRGSARLAAIDEERDRLAMELHDEVLPDLTALTRRLELDSPAAAADLRQVSATLRSQMGERRLVNLEAFGLEVALRELVEKAASGLGQDRVAIKLEAKAGGRATPSVEAAAYRIARQGLANALEHAGPARSACA
jgi:signal transduction histidine kinase